MVDLVKTNGVDALTTRVVKTLEGSRKGDAVLACLAATSRLLHGPKPWADEVKFVETMLDFASTLEGDVKEN